MKKSVIVLIGNLVVLLFLIGPLQGKTEQVKALGRYDFYHYYPYGELQNYLEDMHAALGALVRDEAAVTAAVAVGYGDAEEVLQQLSLSRVEQFPGGEYSPQPSSLKTLSGRLAVFRYFG